MAFVFRRDISLELGEGDFAFTLKIKRPRMSKLMDALAQVEKAREGATAYPGEELNAIRELILNHSYGWFGLQDDEGVELKFDKKKLDEILDVEIGIFRDITNRLFSFAKAETKAIEGEEKN